MTIKLNFTKSLYLAIGVIVALMIANVLMQSAKEAHAAAPSGLMSSVATSSNPTVTTTPSLVFATTTGSGCAARIITTGASPIMITFSDNQGKVPSGTYGHLQAASTTSAYDGGLYGCQAVRIYSFVSGTISVTETR